MNARVIEKHIEVDGRKFTIYKYPAFVSIKVGKMIISKILPVFQAFVPLLAEVLKGKTNGAAAIENRADTPQEEAVSEISFDVVDSPADPPGTGAFANAQAAGETSRQQSDVLETVMENMGEYLNFQSISSALDQVSNQELDYIMHMSLMSCYEQLQAGPVQVMNAKGAYCAQNLEWDAPLVLRLVTESAVWGLSDFFTADRLKSVLNL